MVKGQANYTALIFKMLHIGSPKTALCEALMYLYMFQQLGNE